MLKKYLTFLPTRKSNLLVAMVTRNPAPINVSGVIAMYIWKEMRDVRTTESIGSTLLLFAVETLDPSKI